MSFFELSLYISLGLIALSLLISFIRLALGPSLPDRVVALDLIASLGIAFIAVYSIITGQMLVLDVGLIIGLLAFLGTVAFARYIERRSR